MITASVRALRFKKFKPCARMMIERDVEQFSNGLLQDHTHSQAVAHLELSRTTGIQTLEARQNFEL